MSSYGVTEEGFVTKSFDQIKADIEARLRAAIDPGLDLTSSSVVGQMFLIFCDELAKLWEVNAAVAETWNPDAAIGVWLENLASISGTIKRDATKSTVVAAVTTDQAVNIAAGDFVVSVDGNEDARFVNAEPIVTSGAETVDVAFEAESTGPVAANAGTLVVIETPTAGVTLVTNALDAELGSNIESDDELRARRDAELDAIGSGTVDSIRARLLRVDSVEDAVVIENTTDVVDAGGRPPHSVHAIVLGGEDADLWQALWDVVGGGIATHGAETGDAVDSLGATHSVSFDRVDEREIYIEVDVDIDEDLYPEDGDEQIKDIIVAKGNELTMGENVIALRLRAEALNISGVIDVTGFRLGFASNPSGTANLTIDEDEIAVFDTSRVTVETSEAPPP